MARRGVGLVYGGGRIGLMGLVADAVLDHGGRVHGVIPGHLVRAETAHERLDHLDVVSSMHERKCRMEELSDGFVVLPGGFGTFDEVFEILAWNQLGLIAKPLVFLNVAGYFTPLMAAIDHMFDAGFVKETSRTLLNVTDDVARAVDIATGPACVVDAKRRDVDVDAKRRDVDVDAKRRDVDVDAKRRDVDVDAKRRDVDVDAKRRDVDVDAKRRDVDVDAKRRDVDVDAKRRTS